VQQQTITRKPAIRLGMRPHIYNIESATRPGVFHTTDAYKMTCTCEAGRNGRRCWHVATAVLYDQWRKEQRAKNARPAAIRPTGMAALQDAFA